MKKILLFILLGSISQQIFAQFPGGGPGGFGGGFGGDGNNRKRDNAIPGTANDNSPKGSGKITGYLVDSAATQAVEYASIALTNITTKKVVDGATADEKGKFSMTRIAAGDYKVTISFMGYATKVIDNLKIDKGTVIDLGVVKLSPSNQVLNEVTVTGQRALIEDKVDRMVYNAEKDATNKGGDATEVLKKVPMLSVDLDGNVSLRGSQSVKVLINNKPSTIIASSVADALKQIPSDMIKSVEVITSPSAKYDAEGSAGIINIITKKNNLQGLTLNIESSFGLRGSNLGLNGNYRKGNMGFSLGGHGRANYNTNGRFDNVQTTTSLTGIQTKTIQGAETRNEGIFGQYQLGWDYDIDKFNTLTAGVRLGLRNQNNYQDRLMNNTFLQNTLINSTSRDVNTQDFSNNVDANLDYTHTFKKPQQEFSILTQYSRNNRTNDFLTNNLNTQDFSTMNRLKTLNDSYNQEITVQADYQTPISKLQMIEMGVKGIFRQVSSDFQYLVSPSATAEYVVSPNKQLSNVLNYNQNITAAYTSYTMSTKTKYSFKIGVRYEHTDITAKLKEGAAITIPSYDVLVPSINISKSIKGGTTFKLAYNRRIQRPSIQFLNPSVNAANPLNISYGNPSLQPEYANNYEASVNTFLGNTFLTFSLFYRNTNDAIESVRDVIGRDTIRTTYQNIGKQNAYGFNLFANVNIGKLQLGGGTDVYYADLSNNVANPLYNATNSGWVVGYRMFGSYTLGGGWGLQAFSFMRSRQVQLQGFQGGFGIYSLSLKKDFKNKKGSWGFGAENFFTPEFKINNEINSPIIAQQSTNIMRNMNFKINFSYRIGKMTFGSTKKKKSVENDDLKSEGSGTTQPAQGGGGQGGGRPGGN